MTTQQLMPVHSEVCKIEGVENLELSKTLTFEKNGCKWEVFYIPLAEAKEDDTFYVLHKNGDRILGFSFPESISKFFET